MFERFHSKTITATAAALVAALGVGGIAVAQNGGSSPSSAAPAKAPAARHAPSNEVPGQESTAPENSATDHDNVQQGDQNAPDPAGQGDKPDNGTESGSEVPNNDGPGGWADEANGNPNADTQQQGEH